MNKSSMVFPDVGTPSDRQTIEEQGQGQGTPPTTAPFPILIIVFAFLGYLAFRKVWLQ